MNVMDKARAERLSEQFADPRYRHGYVGAHTRNFLAHQMRALRGDMTQADFADKLGMRKTVIGRYENPMYGPPSLRTLLRIAKKLDIAVFVRFVAFPKFIELTDDLSDEAAAPSDWSATITKMRK